MLKIHLHVFFFKSKKLQGFSSDRKILMSLLSALFHVQNRVLVFEISILAKIFGEMFIMSLKSPHFLRNSDTLIIISRREHFKRNLRHYFF